MVMYPRELANAWFLAGKLSSKLNTMAFSIKSMLIHKIGAATITVWNVLGTMVLLRAKRASRKTKVNSIVGNRTSIVYVNCL